MKKRATAEYLGHLDNVTRVRSSRWLGNFFDLGAASRAAELFAFASLVPPIIGILIIIGGAIIDRQDVAFYGAVFMIPAPVLFAIAGILEAKARQSELKNRQSEE